MFELLKFIFKKKKYWLLPAVIALFIVSGILVLTQMSAVAPMIYTIF